MPAADLAMHRKVPIRLIWMMRSKASSGKCRISPLSRSRPAVLYALPVPAQLTRMRSCPINARDRTKPASTEQRDLDPVSREPLRRRRAQAGGAAGDDCGDRSVELHRDHSFRSSRNRREGGILSRPASIQPSLRSTEKPPNCSNKGRRPPRAMPVTLRINARTAPNKIAYAGSVRRGGSSPTRCGSSPRPNTGRGAGACTACRWEAAAIPLRSRSSAGI